MMRKASPETKVTKYRMWKSGKQWLFGASLVAASLLVMNTQAFADDGNQGVSEAPSVLVAPTPGEDSATPEGSKEAVSETEASPQPAAMVAGSEGNSGSESSQEAPKPVALQSEAAGENLSSVVEQFKEKKPVHIHFETDDKSTYGVWVWGSGIDQQDSEKTKKAILMTVNDKGVYEATLQVAEDKTYINYIIVKAKNDGEPDWGNEGANKQTGNMIATVNEFADTHIYLGKDKSIESGKKSWYSQASAQTSEFDEIFAYTDKIVDPTQHDKFKTVGKVGRLGATLNDDGKTAKVNLWAPTAKLVRVNLYDTSKGYLSEPLATVNMTRGINMDRTDYKNNTIGVWSLNLNEEFLRKHNLKTANMLSYDFELEIPNAYFIQVEEKKKQSGDQWVHDYYMYRNSKTGTLLNGTANSKLGDREAKWEEIAAFYAGDVIEYVEENNTKNIKPQTQVYQIVKTQDPYSVGVVQNGSRSVILNPSDYGKVVEGKNVRVNSLSELSVMEIDVRDFSIDRKSGVDIDKRGNFLGLIQEGTKNGDQVTGLDYLKYTGVKYVQVMPVNDFQTVPELDKGDARDTELAEAEIDGQHENQQNWGYDPKNYNVPDGSYSSDPSKPEVRIKELKEMINGLHKAGINVVLDVVYNHLYHGQENTFEWTVPGYYYAVNGDNAMNNDVGVGNAVRSNSRMMRQYIVNSVVYWATEYGVDGFRFDAMSDLDTKTLAEVRAALDKIDSKIVTYGEGWDSMGNYLKNDGDEVKSSIGNANKLPRYGFFDAIGRDAIAGSQYNDQGGAKGFVNEDSAYLNNNTGAKLLTQVVDSLLGGLGRSYSSPSQQLNYIEVHDGKTLYDLLKKYNPNDTGEQLQNRIQLATAMSALSQGIHFSQMGQEFGRTKNHKHNTYNAGDVYNKIDWDLIGKNPDMVNFYKALVAFRTQEALLHLTDYNDVNGKDGRNPKMVITNAQDNSGIITYELRSDNNDKYLVVFNNNTNATDNHQLVLGGNQYYYGQDKSKGQINASNDFSKAFIVASNSKNLYNKIGQFNGEKTITLNHLSATVLFIPGEPVVQGVENRKQTISYFEGKNKTLKTVNDQEIPFLKVMEFDPTQKFTFEKSGITTTSEDQLGHRENIVKTVNDTDGKVVNYYYAVDKEGKFATEEQLKTVTFGDDGKLSTIDGYTWHLASVAIEEDTRPQISNHGTPQSTDANIEWKEVTEAAPAELNVSQDSGEATEESPKESERPSEGSTVGNNFEQGESVTQKTTVTVTSQVDFPKSQSTKPEEKPKLTAKFHKKAVKQQLKLERKAAKKMIKKGRGYAWGNKHYFAFDGAVLHLGRKSWFN
ncbi:KxYKxGKxW signal peptide domain-containing protein [Streptococcus dysgalactiae]|uniref:KxYKxGKxW signal peptide domain-containing protein n=1 Tax=Streptococcus dysgalactiae TaxID=1334 RepID=UPI00117D2B3A|nr:KxYKxGKxW signal peptide domain-containing protein [Streptococcus dysgalactiae]